MRGCQLAREGDRLTIRPALGTRGAPLVAGTVFAGALVYGGALVLQAPGANLLDLVTSAGLWVCLIPIAGAVLWFRAISHPVVLDKGAGEISYASRRESLAGARAVGVKVCTSSDSADHYEIEIAFDGRRVTVGCAGWMCETDRARAEANAATIAEFLGVPVEAVVSSGTDS